MRALPEKARPGHKVQGRFQRTPHPGRGNSTLTGRYLTYIAHKAILRSKKLGCGMLSKPAQDTVRRILIVGDPALGRGLLRVALTRLGYMVCTAGSGAEALTVLAQTSFTLVMIAVRLPDTAGGALAAKLAAQDAGHPPILMFGDAIERGMLQDATTQHISGYLVKPISVARLVITLRELTAPADPLHPPSLERPGAMSDPVDLDHLGSFTAGDRQLERELGSLFMATATQYVERMTATLGDQDQWRRLTHALKGASANFGATQLATLARAAETAEPGQDMIASLQVQLDRVARFLERRHARLPRVGTA